MSELLDTSIADDIDVVHITDDSRDVRAGTVFFAVPGLSADGRAFIADAASQGAVAILAEPPVPAVELDIPLMEVADLGSRRGELASRFYGNPSEKMLVVAVTGTNGKTSCSHFIAQALSESGRRCGVMGTLGYGSPGDVREPGLTTPGAIECQRRLSEILEAGGDGIALEASSHGLVQDRLAGTDIDIAVFTNITRDHLDYHETFADYKAAKQRLFEWRGLDSAVLNIDDEWTAELESATVADSIITYGMRNRIADVYCSSLYFRADGFDADVVTPWGSGEVRSSLLGDFNVSNLLAAVAVLGLMGHDIEDICRWASDVEGVPGRMDLVHADPSVVIDYAHTPDALQKALEALSRHKQARLFCVVGCGGDRDRGKRPVMAALAATLADRAILTSDNPRSEDPAAILDDMVAGLDDRDGVSVIADRGDAIALALSEAQSGDIVLIAGKGHEDYQEVAGKRIRFSDYDEVRKHLGGSSGGVA